VWCTSTSFVRVGDVCFVGCGLRREMGYAVERLTAGAAFDGGYRLGELRATSASGRWFQVVCMGGRVYYNHDPRSPADRKTREFRSMAELKAAPGWCPAGGSVLFGCKRAAARNAGFLSASLWKVAAALIALLAACSDQTDEPQLVAPNSDCWQSGHYCTEISFLESIACSEDGSICCRFGTSCVPCGWTRDIDASQIRAAMGPPSAECQEIYELMVMDAR